MAKPVAIYPGTFDPFTNGHVSITRRALALFDKVVVAVSDHGRKQTLFSLNERCEMIKNVCKQFGPKVEVVSFDNLATLCARKVGASVIIRGLRVNSDFDYEFMMSRFIHEQDAEMEVIYLLADKDTLHISSTAVKEIARMKQSVGAYVPPTVQQALVKKYA